MSIWDGLKSIFGFEGVGNTAIKIVEKLSGTDVTPQQTMQFILEHAEKTKHQSPTRRFIAAAYTIAWLTLVLAWLVSSAFGHVLDIVGCINFANDIKSFMASNVNIAMNGILAFYFLMNMRK